MKSIKSILKIAGAVMAVIGTVLVVVGFLDEICAAALSSNCFSWFFDSLERPEAAASGRFLCAKAPGLPGHSRNSASRTTSPTVGWGKTILSRCCTGSLECTIMAAP